MNKVPLQLKNADRVEVESQFSLQHFIANVKEQQGVHSGDGKTFYPLHGIATISTEQL